MKLTKKAIREGFINGGAKKVSPKAIELIFERFERQVELVVNEACIILNNSQEETIKDSHIEIAIENLLERGPEDDE